MSEHDAPDEPQGEAPEPGSGKGWKIAAAVAVLAAVVSMGGLGYLLLTAGDDEPDADVRACIQNRDFTNGGKRNCPPKDADFIDGLVQETTATGFDLITLDSEKRSLKVRPADRPYIDIQHAQSHASLGQPVRVYTERIDGETVIVYLTDPPLEPCEDCDGAGH